MTWIFILGGLTLLSLGGELLVRGSSRLAQSFSIPSLVIGLTVVAFGTSSPELFVSMISALGGNSDIAVSNVVGSNIFNVLLILGLAATICPLHVSLELIRQDIPIMIVISLIMFFFGMDGNLDGAEGTILASSLALYIWFCWFRLRKSKEGGSVSDISPNDRSSLKRMGYGVIIIVGLALLSYGADLFVRGASALARSWGISEVIIGLTIVSAGTSLPELATSIIAAVKGERDIAIGNIVGSNIFNLLGVLGISTLVSSTGLQVNPSLIRFDIPVMLVVSLLCFPVFFTGKKISRPEGIFFLFLYGAYLFFLIQKGIAQ